MCVLLRFSRSKSKGAVRAIFVASLVICGTVLAISTVRADAQLPRTATAQASRSLEALGRPTIVGNGYTNSYHKASTTTLEVGFTKYSRGFQMTSTACWSASGCARRVNYTWKVPSSYRFLKGAVGYDLTNSCAGSTVRFLGNGGAALRFKSGNGKVVEQIVVPAVGAAQIDVDFAGNSVLTIQLALGFAPPAYHSGSCGGELNSAIDVVNDQLS